MNDKYKHTHDNQPFAGRDAIYARLQQTILDPPHRYAVLFIGYEGIGKSRLLQHFNTVFDDPIYSLYLPLKQLRPSDETVWIDTLIEHTNRLLDEHSFSLSRLPSIDEDDAITWREWFRDVYLVQVFSILRGYRRLVWLLDDANFLLDGQLPDDHLDYLKSLLDVHPQLVIILTLDTEFEHRIGEFAPLVNEAINERLHPLDVDASTHVIRHYAPNIDDDALTRVYELTGGKPQLLQRYGQALTASFTESTTREHIQAATKTVYAATKDEFRVIWQRLGRDERLTLTAIVSLLYNNPLQAITPRKLESWLVESDYPMDVIAINAALRGLSYREIVTHVQGGEVQLTTGLMQMWLIENAMLNDFSEDMDSFALRWWMVVLAVGVILVAIVIATQIPLAENTTVLPAPTVTLSP